MTVPRSGWLAVGAALGAGLGTVTGWVAIAVIGSALVGWALAARSIDRGRTSSRSRAGATTGIAVLAVGLRVAAAGVPPPPAPLPDGNGPWTAIVGSVGTPRDGQQVARLTMTPATGDLAVAATLPRYPELAPGTIVRVDGMVRPPPDDDYGAYLRRTGIAGTLRSRTLEIVREETGVSLDGLRRMAGAALARALPEPEAGLAAGILIGLRERVDRELATDFATAGASHVVAISGWNIALVGGLVAVAARSLARRRRALLIALAIVGYTALAGGSPSVVRAAAMATVVLVARESGRAGRAGAALGWAATLLLLAQPQLITDAGFQLSVVATAGLLAWASPLGERIGALGRGHLPGWLVEGLAVSTAAQAATLPIVLGTFGRLSIVATGVNLLVVPLVPLAMAAGVLALVGGALVMAGAPAAVGTVCGLPAWLVLTAIVRIVEVAADLPLAAVALPEPLMLPVAGGVTLAIGCIVHRPFRRAIVRTLGAIRSGPTRPGVRAGRPARAADAALTGRHGSTRARPADPAARWLRIGAAIAVMALVLGGLAVGERLDRATTVTVLDVGQGDAVLLETASGRRMLVDGGPDPDRLLRLLDARIPAWDRRLDLVVLSHPHEDHAAGLALLLDRYAVTRVAEPGMRGPGPGWVAWDARIREWGIARSTLAAGAAFRIDEVALKVLWPEPGSVPFEPPDTGRGINDVSIVLLAEIGPRRLLLTGDVEEDVDPAMLAAGLPAVDVVKVAHHGSGSATTEAFLDAVRPRVAIVSAGAGNRYGHPAPRTLERLRERGIDVRRTDDDGSVEVRLEDGRVTVRETGGRSAAAAPNAAAAPAAAAPNAAAIPSTLAAAAPNAAAIPSTLAAANGIPVWAFACALPIAPGSVPPPDEAVARATRAAVAEAGRVGVRPGTLGYHRPDDDPGARGRLPTPVLPPAPRVAPAALARGGRGRGLARPPDRGGRHPDRPDRGRGRGAPPRRGQASPRERSRAPPPARRRLRGVADARRIRRACPARPGPSRDPPPRRRPARRRHAPRGACRHVRRQARRAAPRVARRAVRLVASSLPRRTRHRRLGRRDRATRPGPCRRARGARLRRRPRATPRRPPARLDGRRDPPRDRRGDRTDVTLDPRRGDVADVTPRRRTRPMTDGAALAHFRGDDRYSIDRAVLAIGARLAETSGAPPERWRTTGAETTLGAIAERVATSPLFGGGTVVVIADPGPLLRSKADRESLVAMLATVAPGNGLCFLELSDGSKRSAALQGLEAAVAAAGGVTREYRAPKEGQLAVWIMQRAAERGIALAQGSAAELARRVGGFVREGDVDRANQGSLAVAELEKLALYRGSQPIRPEDVAALTPEVVPGSTWAFLDALAARRVADAGPQLDRLLDAVPEPVLLVAIHRRLREILEVADHLSRGATPGSLVRTMNLKPFRADKLAEQARAWSPEELEDALDGLLELDALLKRAPGSDATDRQRRLAWILWVEERIARRAGARAVVGRR